MTGKFFHLRSKEGVIRFSLYHKEAPQTCLAFLSKLPWRGKAVQARLSGEEIYIEKGPALNVPQENTSIFLRPGEIGYAVPIARSPIKNNIAIVYGEAKLFDGVNVFARVVPTDLKKLKNLGKSIWLNGAQILNFTL